MNSIEPQNDYKLPLGKSLNEIAVTKAADYKWQTQSWPCTVAAIISSGIVQINFEVDGGKVSLPKVIVPVGWSEYTRLPVQVGDKGLAVQASLTLGGLSGLGSGLPNINRRMSNLQGLIFVPIGNTNWSTVVDQKKIVLYGPDGAVIRSTDSNARIVVDGQAKQVTIDANSYAAEVLIDGSAKQVTTTAQTALFQVPTSHFTGNVQIDGTLNGQVPAIVSLIDRINVDIAADEYIIGFENIAQDYAAIGLMGMVNSVASSTDTFQISVNGRAWRHLGSTPGPLPHSYSFDMKVQNYATPGFYPTFLQNGAPVISVNLLENIESLRFSFSSGEAIATGSIVSLYGYH
jgi:hypothetical protein